MSITIEKLKVGVMSQVISDVDGCDAGVTTVSVLLTVGSSSARNHLRKAHGWKSANRGYPLTH